jgi:hypothetical protein
MCALAVTVLAACNSQTSVIDQNPARPSPVGPLAADVVSLVVDPSSVLAGGETTGRLFLTMPAPASGVTVALSSADPAVSMPASVVVPAGADSASFPIAVRATSADTVVALAAASAGRRADASVLIWARTPPFIALWRDDGSNTRITTARGTASSGINATCSGSGVYVNAGAPLFGFLSFVAPNGSMLVPGTYEGAQTSPRPSSLPTLELGVSGFSSCSAPTTSRFVVTEAQFGPDPLRPVIRFAATFEQRCGPAVVRGEVLLVGVTRVPTNAPGTPCLR